MTVLPTGSEADRVEQETFVFDSDRESGLDVTAVHAQEPERSPLDPWWTEIMDGVSPLHVQRPGR
ncbi:hypothetical protein ACFVJ5_05625 [Nocardia sp. NPDC127606]|uniref:hypothetical protein n=1 Tax=Nocardia sp. NPDC127606 TaxID=3345406 RepID=UPI0036382B9C